MQVNTQFPIEHSIRWFLWALSAISLWVLAELKSWWELQQEVEKPSNAQYKGPVYKRRTTLNTWVSLEMWALELWMSSFIVTIPTYSNADTISSYCHQLVQSVRLLLHFRHCNRDATAERTKEEDCRVKVTGPGVSSQISTNWKLYYKIQHVKDTSLSCPAVITQMTLHQKPSVINSWYNHMHRRLLWKPLLSKTELRSQMTLKFYFEQQKSNIMSRFLGSEGSEMDQRKCVW